VKSEGVGFDAPLITPRAWSMGSSSLFTVLIQRFNILTNLWFVPWFWVFCWQTRGSRLCKSWGTLYWQQHSHIFLGYHLMFVTGCSCNSLGKRQQQKDEQPFGMPQGMSQQTCHTAVRNNTNPLGFSGMVNAMMGMFHALLGSVLRVMWGTNSLHNVAGLFRW